MKFALSVLIAMSSWVSQAQHLEIVDHDYNEIDRLLGNYQFDRALTLLNQVVDSSSIELLQKKGHCYFQLGKYKKAIQKYEQIVAIDSVNTHALVQLAQLYAREKQYENAYACYEKLIASDSLNSFYYKQYGIVAIQAEAVELALPNLFETVRLNAGDVEAYVLLGDLLIENDQFKLADSVLSHALTVSSSATLTLLLAKAQLGEKKFSEVIKTTGKLLENGDTLNIHARLMGISYFHLHEYDRVIPYMNLLLKRGLKAEWIYYYMGVAYQHLDDPDSAIIYLNNAIEEGTSENMTQYYVQLATSYENTNDFKSAIKYYKAAYETSKKDILLYHLGRNYDVYYKDKTTAISYFKRYLDSDDTIKVAREYTRSRLNELEFYR
jgi:tetratricopeptide (TPR) repeat protein